MYIRASRVIPVLDKSLDVVVLMICILLLLIGGYSLIDNYWLYQHAADRSILNYKPDLNWPLEEQVVSPDQVAWLHIFNTDVDYPVLQGKDNIEYLNKDPFGDFSLSGSIFLDYRNHSDFSDDYSLLYGHHMQHGAMFGALDDFQDRTYFEEHRKGRVVTRRGYFNLELFAVTLTEGTDQKLFDPEGRTAEEILESLRGNSLIYMIPKSGARILAMSTCSGDRFTQRLLVFGTLEEHGKTIHG